MSELIDPNVEENERRPQFLKVLCILSFISIGMNFIFSLGGLLTGPTTEEDMLDRKVESATSISELKDVGMYSMAELMAKLERMAIEVNDSFYFATLISLITIGIGLYGVLKMWAGAKIGFHLYIIYCLLSIGAVYLYVSPSNIPSMVVIFNLLLSGMFVLMYSRNLKWMR
ncbi:MAG: hypothetical protein JKY09_02645 [Crocinitomicaceae bacterium]|nr:hypothetical protein [Crocinitomicaceae bacterium]